MQSATGTTLSRRRFLTLTGALAAGSLALSASTLWPRWARAEPELATRLLRLGRDIYPHEAIADRYYLAPLTPLLEEQRELIAAGLDDLDRRARAAHGRDYAAVDSAAEREALLRQIEDGEFFQAVRNTLVVGLYDTPELWQAHFGYEGSSWEQGGYVGRGYNDLVIDWL
ncbi:twin-arginine translocation signal domain-containing protein [Halomonas sp. MCCC 1A17488]|uniref:gluconate 2-dehydrogenase subunit 3 family protein n=1 Tax=unclassified Halomonas TaxID=2609666 RepID=UPI0018D2517D|nr:MULTISPECIES: gluconate 2-dehydrogenase subunit 3 family protein [unclassified Halomonas]MCE8015465.1 twin-arginine translocation signal domain-containing protein [Halomonas sp. MCCC 1A17488]MCG3238798.1 twin-arginine translocation signal domain-containing protein [Halomonas sp. MCCC 1A17488]QPP51238.1 gluconate 2-dehydrogenase subunit 3 family protein [Halomonas sp. SS10-MC5]